MKSITAKEGYWFTQAEATSETQRIFVAEVYLPDNADASAWVEVSDEYKQAWETANPTPEASETEDIDDFEEVVDIEALRRLKLKEIEAYDASSAVNSFSISGLDLWLDRDARSGLMNRFNAEEANGKTQTILWAGAHQLPLQIEQAKKMLYDIEYYASKAYDVTQAHKAAVSSLQTAEEIEQYDITADYPEKLILNYNPSNMSLKRVQASNRYEQEQEK